MRLTVGQTVYLYLTPETGTVVGGIFSVLSQGAAATVVQWTAPEYPGQYCIEVKVKDSDFGSFLATEAEIKDWDSLSQVERDMQYAVAELSAVETSIISNDPAYVYVDDLGPGLAELLRTSREHGTNAPFRAAWEHLVEK